MSNVINTKQLRAILPDIVKRVKKGDRFTVLYRSTPAFQIVPVDDSTTPPGNLQDDSLYKAPAIGSSSDGLSAEDHDKLIYG